MMARQLSADPETDDLVKYFTDVEYLRDLFARFITAEELPKRILAIHGVGGVGKSSLLRMFRLHARNLQVPVALTSAEESKSASDVLSNWSNDLKADGVALGNFQKTLIHYKAIQAKVEDQAKKAQEARKKAAEKIGTAVAKAAVSTAINLIPGAPIVTALIGVSADAIMDWLSSFLTKPDIDLFLDPAKALSKDFLEDIAKVARKRRLVLMLDTFEQMSALNDWICDIAKQLDENILLVIAGREMVNWDRQWDGWLAHTQVEELHPMTEDNMRELARRYYATMVGGEPDPNQVEAIIAFARGLPMVLATSVRLWVKYGRKFDIGEHKAEVYGDVVKWLREGVSPEFLPVLESAAIVRWFNQSILRSVTKLKNISAAYEELRRFPFVKSGKEGLRLHDSVRDIMEESLRVDDPDRHKDLHERVAKYFEKQLKKATSEEAGKIELEWLYHRIRANEKTGMRLFQETAERLSQYGLWSQLGLLLNDVNNYPLDYENSRLWREFYNSRLLSARTHHVEAIPHFEQISQNPMAERKLQLYSLGELAECLSVPELLAKPGYADKASLFFEKAAKDIPSEDINSIRYYYDNIVLHRRLSHWNKVAELYPQFPSMIENLEENSRVYFIGGMKDLFGSIGNWREYLNLQENIVQLTPYLQSPYTRVRNLTHWIFVMLWMGRFAEVERTCREGLETYLRLGHDDVIYLYRNIAYALALQNRFQEAETFRQKFIQAEQNTGSTAIAKERSKAIAYGFWGPTRTLEGDYKEARCELLYSLSVKRRVKDIAGYPELFVGLGVLYETTRNYLKAIQYYERCIKINLGRRNFESAAYTGLVRAKYAQGDYVAIPQLLSKAEQISQEFEYNDHLASLRLTQGHIAWEQQPTKTLRYYKHALIYALRYNRFLLDEVLSGRPQGTPLRPIIPFCLERGDEGRKMLMALQKWWKRGTNDIGIPRPDTISPIPEDIPLLEAEKLARTREPGDGSKQKTVLEQLDAAIESFSNPQPSVNANKVN
jgi:tetratricopeptide (TPR) repeat protein